MKSAQPAKSARGAATRNPERTRGLILSAALKEFAAHGFAGARVDAIARSGYIVFKSDYRGHDKSQGVAQGAYGHPDYVVDVLNALATLKHYPQADPHRIGMWGHSMGGYITLRAMVISKDIRAGVIWGGVVASYPDLLSKWVRGPGAEPRPTDAGVPWHSSLSSQFGSPEQNPAFWNSISANSYLADISGPVILGRRYSL